MSRKSIHISIISQSNNWLLALINFPDCKVLCEFVYFRPTNVIHEDLTDIQSQLEASYPDFNTLPLYILGDFNARVGNLTTLPQELVYNCNIKACGSFLDTQSSRGIVLKSFLEENGLILINCRTNTDYPAQYTFCGKGNSTIDLAWTNCEGIYLIEDFVVQDVVNGSDHFPIVLTLKVEGPNSSENHQHNTIKWKNEKKYDYRLAMKWSNLVQTNATDTVTDLQNRLREATKNTALKLKMIKSRKPPIAKKWYDNDCKELKRYANRELHKYKKSNFEETRKAAYLEVRKNYLKTCNRKKKDYQATLLSKVNNARHSTNFWKAIKTFHSKTFKVSQVNTQKWQEFYEKVYQPAETNTSTYTGVSHPTLDADITYKELNKALSTSAKNKAAGEDEITNEFYQALPQNWKLLLLTLFNRILNHEKIPEG